MRRYDMDLMERIFEGVDFQPSEKEPRCFHLSDGRMVKATPVKYFHDEKVLSGVEAQDVLRAVPLLQKGLAVVFEYKYDKDVVRLKFSIKDGEAV